MAGRPDDWMVEVELVDDDGRRSPAPRPSGDPAVETAAPVEAAPQRSWLRRHPGRVVAGVAMAAVAVAVGVVLVDLLDGSEGASPTIPRDRPLVELWAVPDGDVLGSADGVVVLRTGSTLTGIEAETGRELWQLPLGQGGPADGCEAAVTIDPGTLWCWRSRVVASDDATEDGGMRGAGVVGIRLSDGVVVAEHAVRIPSGRFAAVDGDLVTGDRRDSTLTLARVEPHAWTTTWEVRLELEPRVAGGQYDAWIEAVAGLVVVNGPTTAVIDPADGAVLAMWPPVDDPMLTGINGADVVVTEHGFAAATEIVDSVRGDEWIWHGRDGAARAAFHGTLAEPEASDGSEPGVLLVTRAHRATLVGVDADSGEDLWTFPLRGGITLVRQNGTVVVVDDDEVICLELLTGFTRWRAEVQGLRSDAGGVSDGSVVVVMAVQSRAWTMEAFAVGSGERLWFAPAPGAPDLDTLLIAVALRLGMTADRPVISSAGTLTWLG